MGVGVKPATNLGNRLMSSVRIAKTLSVLTLQDQVTNALQNMALEGVQQPSALDMASSGLTAEWAASDEQPRPADLRKQRVIGEGGYACVYQVIDVRTSRLFALKQLRKSFVADLSLGERILAEKEAHEALRHPFICRLFTTFQDADSLYFVLELARGGDLFEVLEFQGGRLTEARARHYLGCVALALQHMHSHGYVYLDLKVPAFPGAGHPARGVGEAHRRLSARA